MVARAAAEVPAILLVLWTLRVVLQGLLDALGHVAKTGGAEVFERFFNVLAFFRGITGALLRVAMETLVVTGAGALVSALTRAFIVPGLRRRAGWLIGAGPRTLGERGGGETKGGEKRDDAWCLHVRVENRTRALVAKFLKQPLSPCGCMVKERRNKLFQEPRFSSWVRRGLNLVQTVQMAPESGDGLLGSEDEFLCAFVRREVVIHHGITR